MTKRNSRVAILVSHYRRPNPSSRLVSARPSSPSSISWMIPFWRQMAWPSAIWPTRQDCAPIFQNAQRWCFFFSNWTGVTFLSGGRYGPFSTSHPREIDSWKTGRNVRHFTTPFTLRLLSSAADGLYAPQLSHRIHHVLRSDANGGKSRLGRQCLVFAIHGNNSGALITKRNSINWRSLIVGGA